VVTADQRRELEFAIAEDRSNRLSAEAAEALTKRIRTHAEVLWAELLESYQRGAWAALGYTSWRAYAKAEFGMSQSHAYQLLDAARVQKALQAASSTDVEITEAAARDIKPHLEEVVDAVATRTSAGEEPVEVVHTEVAKARTKADKKRGIEERAAARRAETKPSVEAFQRKPWTSSVASLEEAVNMLNVMLHDYRSLVVDDDGFHDEAMRIHGTQHTFSDVLSVLDRIEARRNNDGKRKAR
jgi:hypothetical protein